MQGDNPVVMCEVFQNMWYAAQLTVFVIQLLGMSVNLEHQIWRQKNMTLQPFEASKAWGNGRGMYNICISKHEISPFSHTWCFQVAADFCAVQREAGLVKNHEKWQNHDKPKFMSSSQCLAMWTWWRKTLRQWSGAGQYENSTKANQISWSVVEINEEMGQEGEGSKWWWRGAGQCCIWLPMVKVVALVSWLAVW